MKPEPVFIDGAAREWEGWPAGTARTVGPGVAIVIPGNALHRVEATGESGLRVAYVFATDSFHDVEYVFDE